MAKSIRDFEGLYGKGELGNQTPPKDRAFPFGPEATGPADGFQSQTVVGTARATGTGWFRDEDWTMPEVAPGPTRPAGRSNRTGE